MLPVHRLNAGHATFRVHGRYYFPQQRIAVVGNGNIDVGIAPPNRKAARQGTENLSGNDNPGPSFLKTERHGATSGHPVRICGEMSQQGGDFRGNMSAPQKLVHLVGCREPKVGPQAEPGLEGRQYSNPVKR
jgi:hypothetical protein